MTEMTLDEIIAAIAERDLERVSAGTAHIIWLPLKGTGALYADVLLQDWHHFHEDMVFALGMLGEPGTAAAILQAAQTRFAHLGEWGNLHAFQRKCCFALARIGTEESRLGLEHLAGSGERMLRKYGREGLRNWPMPWNPAPDLDDEPGDDQAE